MVRDCKTRNIAGLRSAIGEYCPRRTLKQKSEKKINFNFIDTKRREKKTGRDLNRSGRHGKKIRNHLFGRLVNMLYPNVVLFLDLTP